MKQTTKTEIYIISGALILSILVSAFFWERNRVTISQAPPKQTSQTTPSKLTAPGQNPVTSQGLMKLKESTPVQALILGDSIGDSYGASNPDSSSWYTLVASDLKGKYPGTLQWHFQTKAGSTVNDALSYVPEVTPDTDLIVLCVGRSDSSRMTLTEFQQKYDQLLVKLKAKNPHADLFVVAEPPVKNNTLENIQYSPYRDAILTLAQKYQLHAIDMWTAFIQDPAPLASLLSDGVNPNDKGYRIFADEVVKSFNSVLMGT